MGLIIFSHPLSQHRVLKMNLHPPSTKRSTAYLYLLPSEILTSICSSLDYRSLKAFACVSRLANSVAIPILIDQACPELKTKHLCAITSLSDYTAYPFKLALHLPPLPVHSLRFNTVTSHTHLLEAMEGARVIISRMAPEIQDARLSFTVSQWGASPQYRIEQSVDKSTWTRTVFSVLEGLLDRGCRSLEIDGCYDDVRITSGLHNYFKDTWQGLPLN